MKRAIGIILLVVAFQQVQAQKRVSLDLMKGSSLTILGKSNIVPFKIFLKGDSFPSGKLSLVTTEKENKIFLNDGQLSVNVNDFTSDNRMALRDFKKLVKSESFPEIKLEITSLDLQRKSCGKAFGGTANSVLTITGVSKQYIIPLNLESCSDFYTAEGRVKLSIRDFGLNPPVEMMGLIKVSEWIEIVFNVNLNIYGPEDSNALASAK